MTPAIGFVLFWLAGAVADEAEADPRAGAWDRSVQLQLDGDLAGAERIMTRGWGSTPDNYWVSLRLAYLALLQGRADEAIRRYQALRTRPEAEGDRDVVRGHGSALAAKGWQLVNGGSAAKARAQFRQALAVDPDNASAVQGLTLIAPPPLASPELWTGLVGHSLGVYRYLGFALYGNLSVPVQDWFVVRVAGRYVSSARASGRSALSFGGRRESPWTLDEAYLSLARSKGLWGGEIVGARSATTGQATLWGGAGRLRVGTFWGGQLEAVYLRASGWARNVQVLPALYYWPVAAVGLQAGARLTHDDRGDSASANAGVSLRLSPLALHLRGHLGEERWAFAFDGPSLASFDAVTSYGGSATLLWSASESWRLAVQGEGERLRAEGAIGYYWSASIGVQYSVR